MVPSFPHLHETDHNPFLSLQAKAVGIQGNLSGDLLQSGGLLVVSKGGSGQDIEPHLACLGGPCPHSSQSGLGYQGEGLGCWAWLLG